MAAIAIVFDTTFERNARRCPIELFPFEVVDFGIVYATAVNVNEARHIAKHSRRGLTSIFECYVLSYVHR